VDFKLLGERVTALRKEKGISQKQIAEDLHISRATLSSFENGGSVDIGCKKVMAILDYFGYEIAIKEQSRFPTFEELRDE